jgi:pimeloyl-ACP methyl ester carboxylesterase
LRKVLLKRRSIRIIAAALVALFAVAVVVAGPQRVFRRVERSWLILTGALVDAGGYRLRIDLEGVGTPTVVMDAGLNQTMNSWGSVPSQVATFTRVVIYNRAGLEKSDMPAGPRPRTSQQIIDDLHTMLVNAGIKGPYVLVGHSFGGLNVRLFASQHPEKVAAIVLVDASHEDQYARFAALKSPEDREKYLSHEGGENHERVDILSSAAQVRAAGPLPAVPLIVLTAGPRDEPSDAVSRATAAAQTELQQNLAGLIPGGRQIVAENSGHFIQLDRPDLVVDAIRSAVEAVRRSQTMGANASLPNLAVGERY